MKFNSRLVHRFVRKELRYEVTFYSVQEYLKRVGYQTAFHNSKNGDALIKTYNLSEYAKSVHAFTFKTNDCGIVFIDMSLPTEDKLYSLLHEAAHIYLNHLDNKNAIENTRLQEVEADTFAYEAITYSRKHSAFKEGAKLSAPLLVAFLAFALVMLCHNTPPAFRAAQASAFKMQTVSYAGPAQTIDPAPKPAAQTVYVARTGAKYHIAGCQYIRNKNDTTELSIEEAKRLYTPCKVCKP